MFYRIILRLAALKPISWVLARSLHRFDHPVLRLSGGKRSLTSLLTGLETVTLTTRGAKTGKARSTPLLAFWDGERVILIASYFGRERHPGWHHNLAAHPHASLSRNGEKRSYLARQANGEERERYWKLGVSSYPGFTAYRERASKQQIPVWVLEPEEK